MRKLRLIRFVAALAILPLFAGTTLAQPPTIVGQERAGVVENWRARSDEAEDRLGEGDFKRAYGIADSLVREMIQRIESGEHAGSIMGQAVLLRALAEAGLKRNRDATWDWFAARAVDPEIKEERLSAHGETGEWLRAAIAAVPDAPRLDARPAAPPPGESGVSRPVKVAGDPPDFPRGSSNACRQGTIVIDAIIDDQGNVRRPTLTDAPGGPVLALATLEALKTWKFRPARFENKPVTVFYTMTVNFSLGVCRNPAAIPQRKKGKG